MYFILMSILPYANNGPVMHALVYYRLQIWSVLNDHNLQYSNICPIVKHALCVFSEGGGCAANDIRTTWRSHPIRRGSGPLWPISEHRSTWNAGSGHFGKLVDMVEQFIITKVRKITKQILDFRRFRFVFKSYFNILVL